MDQTTKYIEALDTLIEYYQGKISELEEIKKGLLVKQMQEEHRQIIDVQEERTIVEVKREYLPMLDQWKIHTIYSDGMVGVTYEPAKGKEDAVRLAEWMNEPAKGKED